MSAAAVSQEKRSPATTHVEFEAGRYVGFVIDGGRVQRIAQEHERQAALEAAQRAAARINRNRTEVS